MMIAHVVVVKNISIATVVLNFTLKKTFMIRITIFLLAFIFIAETPAIFSQNPINPGSEWSKTRHLNEGETTFQVLFARSGWETQQSGEMIRTMHIFNDTLKVIRETSRGNIKSMDTLWMDYPSLIPIAYQSQQKDRRAMYKVEGEEVKIHIDFTTAEALDYSQPVGPGFFDVSALELVLGGLNRRGLRDRTVRLFDPQTSSFINFSVDEVSRERIKDASGNRQRCFLVKGKLNNAEASFWVHRRSGELIKSRIEMSGQMAMIILRE